jgi:hypothetical protein
MPGATLPLVIIPMAPPGAVNQAPIVVEIAFTPSAAADGHYNVSWSITLVTVGGNTNNATQLAGGSTTMLPTDTMAKLLYMLRGAYLSALQNLQLQQILPLTGGPEQTRVQSEGASFYLLLPTDMIASLPSNPRNFGL